MKPYSTAFYRCVLLSITLLLAACAITEDIPEVEKPETESRGNLGQIVEAQKVGEETSWLETRLKAGNHWQEQLDAGDEPLKPGCACYFALPNCGGAIQGRAVDECFPRNGKQILQEKTVPKANCGNYGNKEYDCEKLLGKGATCKLMDLTCCGVKTTSAYCHLEVTP